MNKETVATYMFMRPEKFENAFRLMIRMPLFDKILKQDDKEISVSMSTAIVCVFFLCPLNDITCSKSRIIRLLKFSCPAKRSDHRRMSRFNQYFH